MAGHRSDLSSQFPSAKVERKANEDTLLVSTIQVPLSANLAESVHVDAGYFRYPCESVSLLWLLTNEADTRDETDGSAETKRSRGRYAGDGHLYY